MKTHFLCLVSCCLFSLALIAQQNKPVYKALNQSGQKEKTGKTANTATAEFLAAQQKEKYGTLPVPDEKYYAVVKLRERIEKLQEQPKRAAVKSQVTDTKKTISAFMNAIETLELPYWASKYNNIGMAYIAQQQFKAAFEAFTGYEKRFPEEGMAYRNWAVYYAVQGKKDQALLFLQRAVELGYDDVKWLQTDDSMDGLKNENAFIEIIKKLEKAEKK